MSKKLLDEFQVPNPEEWKDKIIADLKGKDFDETLIWEDENGIKHQPNYESIAEENSELVKSIQGCQPSSLKWRTIQSFSKNNTDLLKLVNHSLENGSDMVVVNGYDHISKKEIDPIISENPRVHFGLNSLKDEKVPKSCFCDPISEMVKNEKVDKNKLAHLSPIFQKRLNHLNPDNFILVDGSIYKNAGATIIQELAYTLHHAFEYIDFLTEKNYTAEAIARSLTFKLGFGTSYFSEIAKARAFRFLCFQLFGNYGVSVNPNIWGEASVHYLAHKDAHTNLLRLTSQCMSIIVGNCDLVSLPTFDDLEKSSALGYRMSKNIPLILKNESYFNKVSDIASGSFYLENLTAEIAKKSWDLFLEIEKEGGLFKKIENGTLKNELKNSSKKRAEFYKNGKRNMVGVNKFVNDKSTDLQIKNVPKNGINKVILSKEILE